MARLLSLSLLFIKELQLLRLAPPAKFDMHSKNGSTCGDELANLTNLRIPHLFWSLRGPLTLFSALWTTMTSGDETRASLVRAVPRSACPGCTALSSFNKRLDQ